MRFFIVAGILGSRVGAAYQCPMSHFSGTPAVELTSQALMLPILSVRPGILKEFPIRYRQLGAPGQINYLAAATKPIWGRKLSELRALNTPGSNAVAERLALQSIPRAETYHYLLNPLAATVRDHKADSIYRSPSERAAFVVGRLVDAWVADHAVVFFGRESVPTPVTEILGGAWRMRALLGYLAWPLQKYLITMWHENREWLPSRAHIPLSIVRELIQLHVAENVRALMSTKRHPLASAMTAVSARLYQGQDRVALERAIVSALARSHPVDEIMRKPLDLILPLHRSIAADDRRLEQQA